ncbi:MAG: aspartate kinase [Erysipelotrichaceae bacterium]|nr:aspartate kinase [Erysipelotrichaceae bacterium]
MVKVVKFGGSSLADATQFRKVYNIINADHERRYVVPSAPGKRFAKDTKVTDLLILAYSHRNEADFDDIFDSIVDRYNSIIEELKLDYSLADEFATIRENCLDNASFDYVISRGEYLNALILAHYLDYDFIDAADVIRIDESGNYDAKRTDPLLKEALAQHEKAVIPGFYGLKNDGSQQIQAFSRGGSDVTGSIVSKCANASLYENWTDVSGFMIADPNIVKHSQVIETITYQELRELSYMGASVLHENSIFPVRSAGIPINIKNTNRPDDSGTLIVETTCHKPKHVITGIAGKKGFATVTIEKDMMNAEIGFCRRVLQVFEDHGLSIEHMPSGIDTMTVVINVNDFIAHEQSVLAGIHRLADPDKIELESDLALIAVVGRGMKRSLGTAARVFTALAKDNINIKMIDQGSSEENIIIGVRNRYFERAIKAIYKEFIIKED